MEKLFVIVVNSKFIDFWLWKISRKETFVSLVVIKIHKKTFHFFSFPSAKLLEKKESKTWHWKWNFGLARETFFSLSGHECSTIRRFFKMSHTENAVRLRILDGYKLPSIVRSESGSQAYRYLLMINDWQGNDCRWRKAKHWNFRSVHCWGKCEQSLPLSSPYSIHSRHSEWRTILLSICGGR